MQRADRISIEKRKAYDLPKQSEYDILLSEAINLGSQHQTKAKYYVPKMYAILVKEGLTPVDAAERMYKDLVGIWQKDTVRRLIPSEAKNQVARERQALSRRSLLVNKAGLILHDDKKKILELENENVRLRKKLDELGNLNRSQLEKILRLQKAISALNKGEHPASQKAMTLTLPPTLFMKTFTLMRSCLRPLVLRVEGQEITDVDRIKE